MGNAVATFDVLFCCRRLTEGYSSLAVFSLSEILLTCHPNSDTIYRWQLVLINGHLVLSLMCARATNSSFRNHVLADKVRRKSYLDAKLKQRD